MKSPSANFSNYPATLFAAFLAFPGLIGCAEDGATVSIGKTTDRINLDLCYPTTTGCSAAAPEAHEPTFGAAQDCAPGSHFQPTVYPLPSLPAGYENRIIGHGTTGTAPDGTFWYTAVGYPVVPTGGLAMHLFLFHVAEEGQTISQAEIPLSGSYSPAVSLVVDGEGVVTVALSDGAIRFLRFGPEATLLGITGSLQPLPNQLVAADSTTHYVVAADSANFSAHAVLSVIRSDGVLERSSNQVPEVEGGQGVVALTSQEQAAYSLLTKLPGADGFYRILRYNRDLSPGWSLSLPKAVPWMRPMMVSDAHGQLVVAELFDASQPAALGFYGASVDGAGLFSFELVGDGDEPSNLMLTAQPSSAKVWASFEGFQIGVKSQTPAANYLAEIDVDQQSCKLHQYPGFGAGSAASGTGTAAEEKDLQVTPAGLVFMLTETSLIRFDEVTAD